MSNVQEVWPKTSLNMRCHAKLNQRLFGLLYIPTSPIAHMHWRCCSISDVFTTRFVAIHDLALVVCSVR